MALVAPCVWGKLGKGKQSYRIDLEEEGEIIRKNWVMTSGSMIHLKKYLEMGDFDEKLFIGHIDVEYGIRICEYQYEIHQVLKARMYQNLGHAGEKKFLWKKIYPYHGALYREYYHTRNQYYVFHKYGKSIENL